MATLPTVSAIEAPLSLFFSYLRPTKSPYIIVIAFASFLLVSMNYLYANFHVFLEREYWFFSAIPLLSVLTILTSFTLLHRAHFSNAVDDGNHYSQLRFSRSICISSALLCLAFGIWTFPEVEVKMLFHLHYGSCLFQIALFVIYAAVGLRIREPRGELNYFQMSVVTSLHLIFGTACVYFLRSEKEILYLELIPVHDTSGAEIYIVLFGASLLVFWILWIFCQVIWLARVLKTIGSIRKV